MCVSVYLSYLCAVLSADAFSPAPSPIPILNELQGIFPLPPISNTTSQFILLPSSGERFRPSRETPDLF